MSMPSYRRRSLTVKKGHERLTAGDRLMAQQWSLAIWRHTAAVGGIRYRVRHGLSELAVALFDRATDAVAVDPLGKLTDHPSLPALLTRYPDC